VSYSYYEVYNNALRAFRGLNFPYGPDEDAAYIIACLELYNLNGLNILANNLDKYDQNFDGKIKFNSSSNSFNLKNKISLMVAPGLTDYIISQMIKNDKISFELKNCSYFIFFIPIFIRIIRKKIFTSVKYQNYDIFNINEEKLSISNYLTKNVYLKDDFKIIFSKTNNKFDKLDINLKLSRSYDQLSKGINPNKNDWKKISEIAFRTYVPESDVSREKGAGGGDDND